MAIRTFQRNTCSWTRRWKDLRNRRLDCSRGSHQYNLARIGFIIGFVILYVFFLTLVPFSIALSTVFLALGHCYSSPSVATRSNSLSKECSDLSNWIMLCPRLLEWEHPDPCQRPRRTIPSNPGLAFRGVVDCLEIVNSSNHNLIPVAEGSELLCILDMMPGNFGQD